MLIRNILTCFCKLVVLKVIPAKYFSSVLVNYVSFFHKFGDIIKVSDTEADMLVVNVMDYCQAALAEIREVNRAMCARVMLMALVEHFDKTEGDMNEELVKEMKEFARRLSMLLGLDGPKNRQAVVLIHKEGIQMALGQEKDRVKMLLGIAEFSGKIVKQDRQLVVNFFSREVQKCGIDEVGAVVIYRNSLLGVQRVGAGEEE